MLVSAETAGYAVLVGTCMKAKNFDQKFDVGEKLTEYFDISNVRRVGTETKRVNEDFPLNRSSRFGWPTGWGTPRRSRNAGHHGLTASTSQTMTPLFNAGPAGFRSCTLLPWHTSSEW